MYGRGTADMKGGLAATFMAVDFLQRLGVSLKGDVVCMTNIEEEIGGSGGVLACVVQAGVRADVALYPHPGPEKPSLVMTGSSGALGFRIRVKGLTTHGMSSHLGVNAIEKGILIFTALKNLDLERGRMVRDEMTEKGYFLSGRAARSTNLYLSALRGGEWIYQVPPSCEMDWMFTFAHRERMEDVQSLIAETVRHACAADPWLRENPATVEWLPIKFSPSRPFPDHPFIRLVQEATQTVTGRPADLVVNPVGSDIRVTVNYGNMPSAILGPTGDKIHAFDEWIDLQSYIDTIKNTALVLMRWCGTA
jgi:acetylornithine deacetylase